MKTLLFVSLISPILAQLIPTGSITQIYSQGEAANLYITTDQGSCSPIYYKQNGTWVKLFSVGNSGALQCNGSQIDISPSVVPRIASVNRFSGLNTFAQLQLTASVKPRPACNQSNRGAFRFEANGSAKDSVLVCVSTGTALGWVALY